MTIFAGIFLKDRNARISDADHAALLSAMTRSMGSAPTTHSAPAFMIAKVDIGAFSGDALLFGKQAPGGDPGDAAMLAGNPVLEDGVRWDRSRELAALAESLGRGDGSVAAKSRGSFVAAVYRARDHELHLLADRGATKPLYFHEDAHRLVFSTQLGIFENLDTIPKRMNIRAITEMSVFGVALADRTPYADIASVRACEWIRFGIGGRRKSFYFRWDHFSAEPGSEKQVGEEAYQVFRDGVNRRLGESRRVQSFLSGGLDSRCVVSVLRDLGAEVNSFNFSPALTLDSVLGEQFSAKVGTRHTAEAIRPGDARHFLTMLRERIDASEGLLPVANAPRQIWDGGGTGLTLNLHRINDGMVALLRAGKTDDAIRHTLKAHDLTLPRSLFQPETFAKLAGVLEEGIREELAGFQCEDPARLWQVFMLYSYEGKHLHGLLEDLGRYRIELVQPFLDWKLVETLFRLPVEKNMWHRFYFPWLKEFPAAVLQVPWQAYSWCPPCPLPLPALPDQWAKGNPFKIAEREKWRKKAGQLLWKRSFCPPLFRPGYLTLTTLASLARLGDYRYAFKVWNRFSQYHEKSGGRMVMP
jgi:asparagine synthase (glutamine-hydrolysing)